MATPKAPPDTATGRTALLTWMAGRDWVTSAEIAGFCESQGLSRQQSINDLRALVCAGKLEKRKGTARTQMGCLANEYRFQPSPDFLTTEELLEELSSSDVTPLPAWQPSEGSRVDRLEVERASSPAGW